MNNQPLLFSEQELDEDVAAYAALRTQAKSLAHQFDKAFDSTVTAANWPFDIGGRRIRISIEVSAIEDDEAIRRSMYEAFGLEVK